MEDKVKPAKKWLGPSNLCPDRTHSTQFLQGSPGVRALSERSFGCATVGHRRRKHLPRARDSGFNQTADCFLSVAPTGPGYLSFLLILTVYS